MNNCTLDNKAFVYREIPWGGWGPSELAFAYVFTCTHASARSGG